MVLYVEAMRLNILNFIQVATALKNVCESVGVPMSGFEGSMEHSRANLAVLDGLLAAGITELEIPQKIR